MEKQEQPGADRPAPPLRKRDAERTRQAILRAAAKEFAASSFSGARTERIAAAAKCNIRLLYHYFGDKQQLYKKVLDDAYADLRDRERKLQLDPEKPLESVLKLLCFTYDYFAANPNFESLLRNENMMRGRFVRQLPRMPEDALHLRGTLDALIASGERKGEFRKGIDATQLYVTITAISRFHLANIHSLSALLGTDMASPQWRQDRRNHAMDLLRTYLTVGVEDTLPPEKAEA